MSGNSDGFIRNAPFWWFWFLSYCHFLMLTYRIVSIGVYLPEFTEIHPNMAEVGSKTLCCADHQQFYFLLLLQFAMPCISHISRRFANFNEYFEPSAPFFRSLPWIFYLLLTYYIASDRKLSFVSEPPSMG